MDYRAGATFTFTESLTLYAVWEGRPYTISFDDNGGRGGTQTSLTSLIFGTAVDLPAITTFTPPSAKQFVGWAETSDGTVIQGQYNPSTYSAIINLHAKWEDKPIAGIKTGIQLRCPIMGGTLPRWCVAAISIPPMTTVLLGRTAVVSALISRGIETGKPLRCLSMGGTLPQ